MKNWVLNLATLYSCAARRAGAGVLLFATASCNTSVPVVEGAFSQSPAQPDAGAEPSSALPGASPLRRLTNYEYRNTLTDLLGTPERIVEATAGLLNEADSGGFRNDAQTLTVTPLLAQEYLNIAVALAPRVAVAPGVLSCDVDAPADTASCAEQFIRDFGLQVYRRPLTQQEVMGYAALYEKAIKETGQFRTAIEWLSVALFTSPSFLFRVELAPTNNAAPEAVTGFEIASRLSYTLWQSTPDQALLEAAAAGELRSKAQITLQAERLLRSPKAYRVYEFFEQWLDLDELGELTRDSDVYPSVPGNLPALLRAESRAFINTLLSEGGTFADLVAGEFTFANRTLAEHYGLNDIPDGSAFERVDAPGRSGILTQGMLLVHDRPSRTSIVRRGAKLRTDLLCLNTPPPPDDVDITLPPADGVLSQRERLEQHRSNVGCSACHALFDPLGVLFEEFGATGQARTEDELGHKVDTESEVTQNAELDGHYENSRQLALALAESRTAQTCLVRQAFRFFYGRKSTEADAASLQALLTDFERNDYRLVDLFTGLTRTDQFLFKLANKEDSQ